MISSFKYILLDVDGVILASIDYFSKIFRDVAEELGAPADFPDSFYRTHIGVNINTWMRPTIPEANRNKLKDLFLLKTGQADKPDCIPLIDGTISTLTKIRNSGRKTALVSTKPRISMNSFMAFYELNGLIDYSISGDEVGNFKPDPEGINKALTYFNAEPNKAVFIGDSLLDLGAARNAGTSFIGVLSGVADKTDWENEKVPYINSIKELSMHINGPAAVMRSRGQ